MWTVLNSLELLVMRNAPAEDVQLELAGWQNNAKNNTNVNANIELHWRHTAPWASPPPHPTLHVKIEMLFSLLLPPRLTSTTHRHGQVKLFYTQQFPLPLFHRKTDCAHKHGYSTRPCSGPKHRGGIGIIYHGQYLRRGHVLCSGFCQRGGSSWHCPAILVRITPR